MSALNSNSHAMDSLRAGVVAPFQGLTPAMMIISSVTISRRLAKSRLLASAVTVEYQLNYQAAIGLTWQDISQVPVQIAAAINEHFQKASISLAVREVTLAEPNPTTSTGASNSSQIAAVDLDLKSAQSVSPPNEASSILTSTTMSMTPQAVIGPALLATVLTFPVSLAGIIVVSFLLLSMILIFARQWYKRRHLNEIKNDNPGSEDLAPASAGASQGPEDDTTSQSDASQACAYCLDDKSALEDVTCIMIRDEGQSTDLDSSSMADDTSSVGQSSLDTRFSPDPDRSFSSTRSAPPQLVRLPALPPASPTTDKRKAGTIAQAAGSGRRRKSKKDQLKAAAATSDDGQSLS